MEPSSQFPGFHQTLPDFFAHYGPRAASKSGASQDDHPSSTANADHDPCDLLPASESRASLTVPAKDSGSGIDSKDPKAGIQTYKDLERVKFEKGTGPGQSNIIVVDAEGRVVLLDISSQDVVRHGGGCTIVTDRSRGVTVVRSDTEQVVAHTDDFVDHPEEYGENIYKSDDPMVITCIDGGVHVSVDWKVGEKLIYRAERARAISPESFESWNC